MISTIQDASAEITWSIIIGCDEELAPLADPAAFENDDFTRGRILADEFLFRPLLGNAKKPLAAIHFLPDVFRANAGGDPQHDQVIEEVGAFLDDRFTITIHRI